MKQKIFILLIFCSYVICSQNKFSKEISFITENDLYTSKFNDRYYTNGMFLSFKYLSKEKKDILEKKIFEWEIGHEMYTPSKANTADINAHDRPFAGYLYGSFSINNIYKNNQSFKTTLQLGVIGSNAFSKELQDFIHDIYGFQRTFGWKYQIKNALALNFNAEFNKHIIKDKTNHFDVTWVNSGKIGTVYTNISTGFLARIGFRPLQHLANSIAYKTNINNKNTSYFRAVESFLFIKPILRYTFYDATLQGSFLNKGSVITNELIPLVLSFDIGFKFTINRFNCGYTFIYNTNKSKGLKNNSGHKYGSINFSYLLK